MRLVNMCEKKKNYHQNKSYTIGCTICNKTEKATTTNKKLNVFFSNTSIYMTIS